MFRGPIFEPVLDKPAKGGYNFACKVGVRAALNQEAGPIPAPDRGRRRHLILNSHRKIEKCSVQELRQTRRRTQAGLTPGKDDNDVWHNLCRNRLKGSMGACYRKREVPAIA